MRAILIDPYTRAISEIQVRKGLDDIYSALSGPEHTVELFTVVSLNDRETLYLDDEGLLQPGRFIWRWHGYNAQLPGRGLILGTNSEGDSISTRMTIHEVWGLVEWTGLESTGDIGPGRDGAVEGPDGQPWPAWIGGAPILQDAGTTRAEGEEAGRDAGGARPAEDIG